jgi:hypothetical protein
VTIATDFQSTLEGHAALTARVTDSIAMNSVPESMAFPLVVYSVRTDTALGLDGTNLGDRAEITVQCWADESDAAIAVAAAVRGAVATVPNNAVVIDESDAFDPELKKHAQILTVVWMA